jgi:rare lipoprotein A
MGGGTDGRTTSQILNHQAAVASAGLRFGGGGKGLLASTQPADNTFTHGDSLGGSKSKPAVDDDDDANAAPDYSLTGKLAAASPISLKAPDVSAFQQTGSASWYGKDFHGRRTASGERFDMNAMTAAHPTLPLASYVMVTNTQNDKSVIVKINDRGPYHGHRIIDLSRAAAKALGMKLGGIEKVKIHGLSPEQAKAARDDMLAGR